jgi:hypothetical protein
MWGDGGWRPTVKLWLIGGRERCGCLLVEPQHQLAPATLLATSSLTCDPRSHWNLSKVSPPFAVGHRDFWRDCVFSTELCGVDCWLPS